MLKRAPNIAGISGWSFDRLLTQPGTALETLDEYERGRIRSNQRINDLLDANNRYLNQYQAERDRSAALERELAILRAGLRAVQS